jgi:hypothetical protein
MFKITALIKKFALSVLVIALGFAIMPLSSASAAGMDNQTAAQTDNSRLEREWAREQKVYRRQGDRLGNASIFLARVQTLIDKANQKGWDTAAVQAALNALGAVIPAIQAAHTPGAAILANHTGFDAAGKVLDRTSAVDTARSLAQVLKDTRSAMDGTGQALRNAIRAFRDAHPRLTTTPAS